MSSFLLMLHNLMRWIIILLAIYAIYNNFTGWRNARKFTKKDKTLNGIFVGTMHLQLLIGLIMYFFVSPMMKEILGDFGAAMKDAGKRFWAMEHIAGMIIGIAVVQIGNIVSKKSADDTEKYRKAFVYFLIGVLIIVLCLPYSFHGGERPLNPFDHAQ